MAIRARPWRIEWQRASTPIRMTLLLSAVILGALSASECWPGVRPRAVFFPARAPDPSMPGSRRPTQNVLDCSPREPGKAGRARGVALRTPPQPQPKIIAHPHQTGLGWPRLFRRCGAKAAASASTPSASTIRAGGKARSQHPLLGGREGAAIHHPRLYPQPGHAFDCQADATIDACIRIPTSRGAPARKAQRQKAKGIDEKPRHQLQPPAPGSGSRWSAPGSPTARPAPG